MIEKGTSTLFREQHLPYSQYANDTINLITDQGALAIYVYLQSKPTNWVIRAKDIQKHFGIGRDKYRSGMRILKDLGLYESRAVRNDSGQYIDNKTVLHFYPVSNEHTESLKTRLSVEDTEGRVFRQSDNQTVGESTPLVIKDSLEIKDLNTSCASDDEPRGGSKLIHAPLKKITIDELFKLVWDKYHNKKKKKESLIVFTKIVKNMTLTQAHMLTEDIQTSLESKNRENAIGWSNTLFSSYLNGECWNDEVTSTQPVKQALDMAARFPSTMMQFLSGVWFKVGDMDDETKVILQYGIENGLVKNRINIDRLTQFGFTRGNEE